MKPPVAFSALVAVALAGCGTTTSFTAGMEEPVKALDIVAAVAEEAEHDVLMAVAAGIAPLSQALEDIVCKPSGNGPGSVRSNLLAFADALDTVRKIGEKPDDTTYGGYLRKLRQNAAAGQAPADVAGQQEEERRKEFERVNRCKALFKADTATSTRLRAMDGEGALPVFFTRLLGLDQLLKALLAQGESVSREAAVRRTIEHLLPGLRKAAERLKEAPTPAYGPLVQYEPGSAPEAEAMNASVLGATINVRRWYVAQQVRRQWEFLARCRSATDKTCFGDPAVQSAANGFAESVYAYRRLARVDSAKVLATVESALAAAERSLDGKDPAAWIDGLIGVADALSALDDAYGKYDKSKD